MSDLKKLSVIELKGKKKSLALTQMGVGSIGTIAGWVYANKTGGGFWRYIGFGLMGGAIVGMTTYFITSQISNKIETELETRRSEDWKAEMAAIGIVDGKLV
jgi:hypothetical protein